MSLIAFVDRTASRRDAERDLLGPARPFLAQSYRNAIAFGAGRGADGDGAITAPRARPASPREAEMVGMVALGRSSADAATSLGIGARTVDKHLQHAFRKLGVRTWSRGAAGAWELDDERSPEIRDA